MVSMKRKKNNNNGSKNKNENNKLPPQRVPTFSAVLNDMERSSFNAEDHYKSIIGEESPKKKGQNGAYSHSNNYFYNGEDNGDNGGENYYGNNNNTGGGIFTAGLSRRRKRCPLIIAILLISLGGVAATFFILFGVTSSNKEQSEEFDRISNEVIHTIETALDEYVVAASFIQETTSWVNTTRQEFQSVYITMKNHPGLNTPMIAHVPLIQSHTQRQQLEESSIRYYNLTYPNYDYPGSIQGLEPSKVGGIPDTVKNRSEQAIYFPCHYVEPFFGNEEFVDFDLYSVPSIQTHINRIMSTWDPTLTSRVGGGNGGDSSAYSVLLLHPGANIITSPTQQQQQQQQHHNDHNDHGGGHNLRRGRRRNRKLQGQASGGGLNSEQQQLQQQLQPQLPESGEHPTSFTVVQIHMIELMSSLADMPQHETIHVFIYIKDDDSTFLVGVTCIPHHQNENETDDDNNNDNNNDNHNTNNMRHGGRHYEHTLEFVPSISKEELEMKYKNHKTRLYTFMPLSSSLSDDDDDTAATEWEVYIYGADGSYESDTTFIIVAGVLLFVLCAVLGAFIYCNINRTDKLNRLQVRAQQEKAKLVIQNAGKAAKRERNLNDFIAHEVRNPLSAAMSATSFVRSEVLDEKQPMIKPERYESVKEDFEIIDSSLHFINDLLRNMLDMQRAGSKKLKIDVSPTHVKDDVLRPVDCMLHRRGADFEVILECDPNLVVLADSLRLKQIILNLARNSIKFVERGFIRLKAEVITSDDDETLDGGTTQSVQLSVEDSGPGIPEAKREQLFGKFQESLDSLHQGTGIGLSLCKQLTSLMGGKLWIDEDYDSGLFGCPGARFVVDLNIPPMEWNDDVLEEYESKSHDIASDDGDKSTSLSTAAGDDDGQHSTCSGGGGGNPKFNNNAATTASGSSAEFAATEKTIAVTADGSTRFVPDASIRSIGKIGSTTKGNNAAFVEGNGTSNGTTNSNNNNDSADEVLELPKDLKVLFVDDDMVLRKLFARSVRKVAPTWALQEAGSGEAALSITKTEQFDVIFMDQYMASVQKQLLGTETTRALRAQGVTSRICGLSANDVEKSFAEAGADSFMLKPFPCKPDALRKELSRVINTDRNGNDDCVAGTIITTSEEEPLTKSTRSSCGGVVASIDVWIDQSERKQNDITG